MLYSLKLSLRRAGFGLGGALLMLVGVGFLTAAAWLILSEARGAQFAALVIGFGYVGAGALVVAIGTRRVPHAPAPGITASGLSAAFAQGFGAGVATRSSMRRSH